jgi:hypothetical protein
MFYRSVAEKRRPQLLVDLVVRVPIRRVAVVLDLMDPLAPELSLDDFRAHFGKEPESDRYRIATIELITSPDDQQPMLVSECAKYSRFVRRESDYIYFRRGFDAT